MRFSRYTTADGTIVVECDDDQFIARFPRGSDNPVYHTFIFGVFAGQHDLHDEDVARITGLDCPALGITV